MNLCTKFHWRLQSVNKCQTAEGSLQIELKGELNILVKELSEASQSAISLTKKLFCIYRSTWLGAQNTGDQVKISSGRPDYCWVHLPYLLPCSRTGLVHQQGPVINISITRVCLRTKWHWFWRFNHRVDEQLQQKAARREYSDPSYVELSIVNILWVT